MKNSFMKVAASAALAVLCPYLLLWLKLVRSLHPISSQQNPKPCKNR